MNKGLDDILMTNFGMENSMLFISTNHLLRKRRRRTS